MITGDRLITGDRRHTLFSMRAWVVRITLSVVMVIIVMTVIAARQWNSKDGKYGGESKHLHGVNLLNLP